MQRARQERQILPPQRLIQANGRLDFHAQMTGNGENVFIATPAHVHNEEIIAGQARGQLYHMSKRV